MTINASFVELKDFRNSSKCKSEIKESSSARRNNGLWALWGVLKKLILNLKYHKSFIAGKVLADLLCQIIIEKVEYRLYMLCTISKDSLKKRV